MKNLKRFVNYMQNFTICLFVLNSRAQFKNNLKFDDIFQSFFA